VTEPIALPSKLGLSWIALGEALGFRVIAPASIEFGSGCTLHVDALLPDFGGRQGMVLVTDLDTLYDFLKDAGSADYGFSALSAPGTEDLTREQLDGYIEVLDDWGWGGDPAAEPEWLKRPPLSERSSLGDEWVALGEALGVRVIAPVQVRLGRRVVELEALVPDFGKYRGTLLVSDDQTFDEYADDLVDAGYCMVTFRGPRSPGVTEEKLAGAIRLLQDWGWEGVASDKPKWLTDTPG